MEILVNVIKGVVIGIATLVPGVSGGTMAIILNVYDQLLHATGHFFKDYKKNIFFLGQIGIGAVLGLGLFSNIISFCLENYNFPTTFLFLGIIFGGIPVMYKELSKGTKSKFDWIYFVVGFVLVVLMTFKSGTFVDLATSTGLIKSLFLVIAGIIIAVALILPGISTSFMLLSLGMYDITINAIKEFNIGYLIPICIGILIGVISTTRILETLLNKKPRQTYLLIIGFILGSIPEVFPGVPSMVDIIPCIATFLIGFILIRYISSKEM